jgi:CelD/BcsL family acetyltransferase involved in cellulose biosynthesis
VRRFCYKRDSFNNAGVTQLVESLPSKQIVAGSNPVARSITSSSAIMFTVREIHDIGELDPYRTAWHALLSRTQGASFFQTLEWLELYWKHYGDGKKLRVLLIMENDELQGILPLVVLRDKTRVGPVRFLTYPLSSWGSFYGPIGPRTEPILEAGLAHIRRTPKDWDVFELRFVDAEGVDGGATGRAMKAVGLKARRTVHGVASLIDLTGSWEDYLATRSATWRGNYRRWDQRLRQQGEVRFVRHRPRGEVQGDSDPRWDLYDACVAISEKSWQGSSPDGTTLCHAEVRPFLREVHGVAARLGALDMNLLLLKGTPLAFSYNYCWDRRLIGLRVGYDPGVSTSSGVGSLLKAYIVRDSCKRGDQLYDLGPGSLDIKRFIRTHTATIFRYSHFDSLSPRLQLMQWKRWWDQWSKKGAVPGPSEQA